MGFDINENYINTAKRRFKDRREFVCAALQGYNTNEETPFDIVLATRWSVDHLRWGFHSPSKLAGEILRPTRSREICKARGRVYYFGKSLL